MLQCNKKARNIIIVAPKKQRYCLIPIGDSPADSPGKSHEYTADLDKRMPVAMVVAMETLVDIGYGPHPGHPALPWKQSCIATIGFDKQINPFH